VRLVVLKSQIDDLTTPKGQLVRELQNMGVRFW